MGTFVRRAEGMAAGKGEGLLSKMWRLGWGVGFVVMMTVLSEFGPRMVASKAGAGRMAVSQSASRCIK